MRENQAYMKQWEEQGHRNWEANNTRIANRKRKDKELEQEIITKRYINKMQSKNEQACKEVVDGISEFSMNMLRQGIEDGPKVENIGKPPSKNINKPLAGFSYAATMNKIKEAKRVHDFA